MGSLALLLYKLILLFNCNLLHSYSRTSSSIVSDCRGPLLNFFSNYSLGGILFFFNSMCIELDLLVCGLSRWLFLNRIFLNNLSSCSIIKSINTSIYTIIYTGSLSKSFIALNILWGVQSLWGLIIIFIVTNRNIAILSLG